VGGLRREGGGVGGLRREVGGLASVVSSLAAVGGGGTVAVRAAARRQFEGGAGATRFVCACGRIEGIYRFLCRVPVDTALGKGVFFYFCLSCCEIKNKRIPLPSVPGHDTRQTGLFAEFHSRHSANWPLCRVSFSGTRQSIFYFFSSCPQTFSGVSLHYLELHVQFWHISQGVCYI
jgi:hypothetical protein